MDDAYVHGSGGKSRSSKRTKTSLDTLLKTMSETSRAKRAHYDRQATSAEEHSMIECISVLKDMPVSGEKYARAADKLISGGKDWRSFFLLSNPNKQLEWEAWMSSVDHYVHVEPVKCECIKRALIGIMVVTFIVVHYGGTTDIRSYGWTNTMVQLKFETVKVGQYVHVVDAILS
ncbi:hypothetical protein LguiA_022932 [Lonicera macranthoides]